MGDRALSVQDGTANGERVEPVEQCASRERESDRDQDEPADASGGQRLLEAAAAGSSSERPVIVLGTGSPNSPKIVGATSASVPSRSR